MEIPKLPEFIYADIEMKFDRATTGSSELELKEMPKIKVRIPPELINRINEISDLLNKLSKSKIIRSAIALEEEDKEEKDG